MRVGVLTFHRCINYGSYWQARCLVEGLREGGHNAVLLDHYSTRIDRAEWRCALEPIPGASAQRAAYRAKTRSFFDAFEELPLSRPFPLDRAEEAGEFDLVLVGSDEVWNFRHPWYGGKSIFFGEDVRASRLASYAASFGNQPLSDTLDSHWAECLKRFDAISVRDANASALVAQATGEVPTLVLDPCLQFAHRLPRAAYPDRLPYAVVYGHDLPPWLSAAVINWAGKTGVRLVSVGYDNPWADEQLIASGPHEFAALMAGATAVVTNFFHGCVFALVHDKPFVTAPSAYRFNKVHDLMATLGGKAHIVSEQTSEVTYQRLLGAPPHRGISETIAALRRQSMAYLDAVLA